MYCSGWGGVLRKLKLEGNTNELSLAIVRHEAWATRFGPLLHVKGPFPACFAGNIQSYEAIMLSHTHYEAI